jgi:hypothetical protein
MESFFASLREGTRARSEATTDNLNERVVQQNETTLPFLSSDNTDTVDENEKMHKICPNKDDRLFEARSSANYRKSF